MKNIFYFIILVIVGRFISLILVDFAKGFPLVGAIFIALWLFVCFFMWSKFFGLI